MIGWYVAAALYVLGALLALTVTWYVGDRDTTEMRPRRVFLFCLCWPTFTLWLFASMPVHVFRELRKRREATT